MWNITTSSAADNSPGSAKKLRENTSNARWRAAAGKRSRSRNVRGALAVVARRTFREADVEQRQRRRGRPPARGRARLNVGLSATNAATLNGGVRGTRAKLSRRPPAVHQRVVRERGQRRPAPGSARRSRPRRL